MTAALPLCRDAARAAHDLHEKGIVHRDIKPSNVMLTDAGAKLSDLGLAHLLAQGRGGHQHGGGGANPEYVDPRLVDGAAPFRRSDIWSLGVTLHWALTGDSLYGDLPDNDPLFAAREDALDAAAGRRVRTARGTRVRARMRRSRWCGQTGDCGRGGNGDRGVVAPRGQVERGGRRRGDRGSLREGGPVAATTAEGTLVRLAGDIGIAGITNAAEIARGGSAIVYRAFRRVSTATSRSRSSRSVTTSCNAGLPGNVRRSVDFGTANILPVHHSGLTASGNPYLIMPFLAQGSLETQRQQRGPLDWREVVPIGVKIATPLERAHAAGILHRDVKPANILIGGDGEPLLRLDFGHRVRHGCHPLRGAPVTPSYAPPEAWSGGAPTPARDVYSLGATLHALLLGHPQFGAVDAASNAGDVATTVAQETPWDLRAQKVPNAVAAAVEHAMAKDWGRDPRRRRRLPTSSVRAAETARADRTRRTMRTTARCRLAPVGRSAAGSCTSSGSPTARARCQRVERSKR